jgi:RES domain-containing protein
MALIWRLARPEFATELDGKGNANTGARWNSRGRGVIYASFNLSLCVLESIVHLPSFFRNNLPPMTAVRIEYPEKAARLDIDRAELPSDLWGTEAEKRCLELGDAWLMAQEHLVCTIPSAVVPQERNVMINPAHPLMGEVKIVSTESFLFDARLVTPLASRRRPE